MSRLPFEDSFKNKMNDLPAGDENASWQKMKELLDEKEKRRPFIWLNIYSICAFVIIITGLGIWLSMSHINHKQKEISSSEKMKHDEKINGSTNEKKINQPVAVKEVNKLSHTSNQNNKTNNSSSKINLSITDAKPSSNKISPSNYKINDNKSLRAFFNFKSTQRDKKNFNTNAKTSLEQDVILKQDFTKTSPEKKSEQTVLINKQDSDAFNSTANNKSIDKTSAQLTSILKNDSAQMQIIADSLAKTFTIDAGSFKKQTQASFKPQKKCYIEAGLQLKQQIPLGGQKIIAYNYNDNKNLAGDYIPSVFIKFEKDKHWFLQGEFSYASPHLIKEFSYAQQSRADYNSSIVTKTTDNLQKTYYSELPLSFNYYLKPHWFVGAGASFNWFHGTVAEEKTITNEIKTGSSNMSAHKVSFKNFNDSFIYKTYTGFLLQTGYSIKRWSFTLRYQQGVQPYIKYTLPIGNKESKKISLLELRVGYSFIRKHVRLKK